MEVILRSSLKEMSIFKATSCVHVPIFRRIQMKVELSREK